MHAVSGGAPSAVALLLRARADPNEANEDGVTPLILSGEYGNLDIVRSLMDAKADPSISAEEWGSALDCAQAAGHADVAAYLASSGATSGRREDTRQGERKVCCRRKVG